MRQLIYPASEVPPIWQDQIFSGLRLTWPEGFFEETAQRQWPLHPEYHPLHIVLADDGLLLSHAAVTPCC